MKIKTKQMNTNNFSSYGSYLEKGDRSGTGNSNYTYFRDVSHLEYGQFSFGLLESYSQDKVFSCLERHSQTEEIMVIRSGSGVIVFAQAGDNPNNKPIALQVNPGDVFAIFPGTWHGLVSTTNCSKVEALVIFKTGTEDNDVDFRELDEKIEIE